MSAEPTEGLGLLLRFAAPHRRWLVLGALGTVGVAAARLAIPWPLRWVIELAGARDRELPVGGSDSEVLAAIVLMYVALAILLGTCELVQRTQLGRFTGLLVDELRSAAVAGARRGELSSKVADVTARVIGDAARLRNDLTGILVHASTNGLLFLAVCAVMFWVSWVFGVVFAVSGALALWIGAATSRSVAESAGRQREKEGQYAASIQAELEGTVGPFGDLEDLTRKSRAKEMRGARRIGRALLVVHGILGTAVSLGLWFGVHEVWAGRMVAGDLFVFAAYALTVHRRMVQVGRQSARSGKVVAAADRLGALLALEDARESGKAQGGTGLRLERAKIVRRSDSDRRSPVLRVDLDLPVGTRTLVVGDVGAGKTSLLELLAGQQSEFRGTLHWDEGAMRAEDSRPLGRVGFLPRNPIFPSRELWQLVGLSDSVGPTKKEKKTLQRIGAWAGVREISRNWSARVASSEVSTGQARLIALSKLLLGGGYGAWVLDGALEGAPRKAARARLAEILRLARDRTVVISSLRAFEPEYFDRLVALRRGRVVYDGSPEEWPQGDNDPA